MKNIKEVVRELNRLYEQTSVRLETFGDPFYTPKLVDENTGEEVFIDFDVVKGEYFCRTENDPYEGKLLDIQKESDRDN